MVVWPQLMSPLDFGSRGERRRWHILAWSQAWLAPAFVEQVAHDKEAFARNCHAILALCKQPRQLLQNFLLSAADPSVQQWLQARPVATAADQSGTSWPALHQEAARVLGVAWPIDPKIHRSLAALPSDLLEALTPRQRDVLFLYVLKHVPALQSEKTSWQESDSDLFLDLSQSWGRVPARKECCTTFLPRSIPVTLGQCRLLTPLEVAKFHGWDTQAYPFGPLGTQDQGQRRLKRKSTHAEQDWTQPRAAFTWKEAMDLFGNSFNGYTTMASLIVGLFHLQGPMGQRVTVGRA